MAVEENSKRLYRIMDFSRVVQIFEKKELYFAKPSTWEDPYEQRIKHSKDHAIFAQCWSELGISDAMWRIYSQNGMGVRISTTAEKIVAVMKAACKEKGYKYRVRSVEYKSQVAINIEAKAIASELRQEFNISRATDMLYLKRDAFRHENEWRATFLALSEDRASDKKGLAVKIDPHVFIDRILLDPRAPEELVSAFKYYFKSKLKFKGEVSRSVLYKSPPPFEIEDDVINIEDL
ncbi:DUF2971 family protein [Pseudomonas protegens]|uniref:DUF2971 domain-containing protein n=1 Tax=Pseudomonas TaxID=286 RepID=UPI000F48C3FA|nr:MULTISPECIES: DUF2971 domain-containing protein [Pseudomonas]MCS4260221.1 hypothetical protein [Pseudomonas sp. BIGb0176]ROQ62207.1 DUF2971 family protein [Pseudomonas protegens]ROQ84526.1 DUF2971 family protein [Pseudomonas protegens]